LIDWLSFNFSFETTKRHCKNKQQTPSGVQEAPLSLKTKPEEVPKMYSTFYELVRKTIFEDNFVCSWQSKSTP
jgi:hypothetical protein